MSELGRNDFLRDLPQPGLRSKERKKTQLVKLPGETMGKNYEGSHLKRITNKADATETTTRIVTCHEISHLDNTSS
jgi:hypothetical protein